MSDQDETLDIHDRSFKFSGYDGDRRAHPTFASAVQTNDAVRQVGEWRERIAREEMTGVERAQAIAATAWWSSIAAESVGQTGLHAHTYDAPTDERERNQHWAGEDATRADHSSEADSA